jgi:hypothetical protein
MAFALDAHEKCIQGEVKEEVCMIQPLSFEMPNHGFLNNYAIRWTRTSLESMAFEDHTISSQNQFQNDKIKKLAFYI